MCTININNEYENILFKTNLLDKNSKQLGKDRQQLFNYICIPIRLLLLIVLLSLSQIQNTNFQIILRILLIIMYLITIIHLSSKKSKCQWWSNEYEIFLSIMAILVCFFVKENTVFYVSLILFASIAGGIVQSILLNPFK